MNGSRRKLRRFIDEKLVIFQITMAAGAIDPVQFELDLKMRTRHEAPQPGGPHLLDILENHVIAYRLDHQIDFVPRETKAQSSPLRPSLRPLCHVR